MPWGSFDATVMFKPEKKKKPFFLVNGSGYHIFYAKPITLFQTKFNKDTNILLQQTTFKEITCQMSAISVYACMCEMIHELLACS